MNNEPPFGQSLKTRRLAAEITLSQLAEGIISVSYLSLIESGKRTAGGKLQRTLLERLTRLEGGDQLTPEFDAIAQLVARDIESGSITSEHNIDAALASCPVSAGDTIERSRLSALLLDRMGNHTEALELLTNSFHEVDNNVHLRIRLAVNICRIAYAVADFQLATSTFESVMQDLHNSEVALSEEFFELRATASKSFAEIDDLPKALELVTLQPSEAEKVTAWQLCMFAWSASTYEALTGNISTASALAHRALSILETLDRPRSLATLRNDTAWIDIQLPNCDYDKTQVILDQAIEWYTSASDQEGLAIALSTRAELESAHGDFSTAQETFKDSLAYIAQDNHRLKADIHLSAAKAHKAHGKYAHALDHLQQATKALEHVPESRTLARIWTQLGDTYSQLEQYDLAYECMKIATGMLGLKTSTQDPSVLLK